MVSNRRAVVEDSMTEVNRGDVVTGIVKAIKPYGAFVEINGVSGLLHISQISYDRIEDLNTVLTANSIIKCMIIDHDKVRRGLLERCVGAFSFVSGKFATSPPALWPSAWGSGERAHCAVDENPGARAGGHDQEPQDGLRDGRADRRQVNISPSLPPSLLPHCSSNPPPAPPPAYALQPPLSPLPPLATALQPSPPPPVGNGYVRLSS